MSSKEDTYDIVFDEEEMKWFHANVLPRCLPNEVHFVSMSARNKKLNEEERVEFQLGRSEMFAKQVIRHDDFDRFLKGVKRFETVKGAYQTKAGKDYPSKVLVCYVNICPVDVLASMNDQMKYLQELQMSLTNAALKGSVSGVEDCMYKVRKSFDTTQSIFARNFGRKKWVDFDVDLEEEFSDKVYLTLHEIFERHFGEKKTVFIKTGGGVHCLVSKDSIHEDPRMVIDEVTGSLWVKEVVRNKNEMCPLPVTLMYGKPVYVLNKADFDENYKD